jgi:transglutaminase-like putative cysteine protease
VPLLKPLSRTVTQLLSVAILIAWVVTMGVLVNRSYVQASSVNLAADLARYGSSAHWRGVYYRGEKIGFTVNQTVPSGEGFELQEDGQLQMSLLGATTAARIRTRAIVDGAFALQSFSFSLDPGTGAVEVRGRVQGRTLHLDVKTASGTRSESRELAEPPVLPLNLARQLAMRGLTAGDRHEWMVFDPATLRNVPVVLHVAGRELVSIDRPLPAFKVEMEMAGLRTTSWITDTGEVLREESPMGLISVTESPERARAMAVPARGRTDLLESAAVVPDTKQRIDDPRAVRRIRLRIEGADLSSPDLQGVGQRVDGNVIELRDPQAFTLERLDPDARQYLSAEPLIESDDPAIRDEAERAVRGAVGERARAERLTRYVNALLEKKPTVSIPSAREVLKTRVGDCNEHTALYVAMARALGMPARIAVGLAYTRGAFYYHAWPEVYITEGGRGMWLPVDPTFNEFPANTVHLRLARGGLEKQAAILPLIGRVKIAVVDVDLAPEATRPLVGRAATDMAPLTIELPQRTGGDCWSFSSPYPVGPRPGGRPRRPGVSRPAPGEQRRPGLSGPAPGGR